jgi:hypothetical protein
MLGANSCTEGVRGEVLIEFGASRSARDSATPGVGWRRRTQRSRSAARSILGRSNARAVVPCSCSAAARTKNSARSVEGLLVSCIFRVRWITSRADGVLR